MSFLYFDPGLGAMIAQAAVAVVAAVALFSKSVMYKIKSILGLHKNQDNNFLEDIDALEDENENDSKQN